MGTIVEKRRTDPVHNWYPAPGVQDKTHTDSYPARSVQIPPLDAIAPTPKSLVEKSREHISDAQTALATAEHEAAKKEPNVRLVQDLHKQAASDVKRAVKLTTAARPHDNAISRLIASKMAEADDAQRDLHELCDEMEDRFSRARELQMAQRLMQRYAQGKDETINLDKPTTEQQEDFKLFRRLWGVCKEEGILLPDDWTSVKRDDLERYRGATKDVVSSLKTQREKDMIDYKRLMNLAQQAWETVISIVVKLNQLIMSAIRAIRGQ